MPMFPVFIVVCFLFFIFLCNNAESSFSSSHHLTMIISSIVFIDILLHFTSLCLPLSLHIITVTIMIVSYQLLFPLLSFIILLTFVMSSCFVSVTFCYSTLGSF